LTHLADFEQAFWRPLFAAKWHQHKIQQK